MNKVTVHMNADRCKRLRQDAAIFLMKTLDQDKKVVINIDETILNTTNSRTYCWQKKGVRTIETPADRMAQVSLIVGVSSNGDVFYTANRGSNTGKTILLFMLKLIKVLNRHDRHWRDNTVILMDNAPYHRGFAFAEQMRILNVPLAYLGPYQFRMAPVEMSFSFIKKHDLNPQQVKVSTE